MPTLPAHCVLVDMSYPPQDEEQLEHSEEEEGGVDDGGDDDEEGESRSVVSEVPHAPYNKVVQIGVIECDLESTGMLLPASPNI